MNINSINGLEKYGKLYQKDETTYKKETNETSLFANSTSSADKVNISSNVKPAQLSIIGALSAFFAGLFLLTGCSAKTENNKDIDTQVASTENTDIQNSCDKTTPAQPSENGVGRYNISDNNQLLDDVKNKYEDDDAFSKNLTGCSEKSENNQNVDNEKADIEVASPENTDIQNLCNKTTPAQPSENGVARYNISDNNQLLDDIKNKCENSEAFLKNATETFNMTEEELTEYIYEMCNSPQFGNGCIEPLQYFALLAQESKFQNIEGDNGRAVGLGQIHEPAVQEVNYLIENNLYEDYDYNNSETYEAIDRWDAKKNVEISLLYLRYCASKTDSTEAMIAMYNTGIPDGIYTDKGLEYVNNVLGKIGESYNYFQD